MFHLKDDRFLIIEGMLPLQHSLLVLLLLSSAVATVDVRHLMLSLLKNALPSLKKPSFPISSG